MAEHFFYHMCYLFYQLLYSKINSIRNVIIVLILNIIFHFLPFSLVPVLTLFIYLLDS